MFCPPYANRRALCQYGAASSQSRLQFRSQSSELGSNSSVEALPLMGVHSTPSDAHAPVGVGPVAGAEERRGIDLSAQTDPHIPQEPHERPRRQLEESTNDANLPPCYQVVYYLVDIDSVIQQANS